MERPGCVMSWLRGSGSIPPSPPTQPSLPAQPSPVNFTFGKPQPYGLFPGGVLSVSTYEMDIQGRDSVTPSRNPGQGPGWAGLGTSPLSLGLVLYCAVLPKFPLGPPLLRPITASQRAIKSQYKTRRYVPPASHNMTDAPCPPHPAHTPLFWSNIIISSSCSSATTGVLPVLVIRFCSVASALPQVRCLA